MAGGAIMISDMFNNALKSRVDALCVELAELIRSDPDFVNSGSFQSQSQGSRGDVERRTVKPSFSGRGVIEQGGGLKVSASPASLGAQNDVRYAYFPTSRRLAIDVNGAVTILDTQDHPDRRLLPATAGIGVAQLLEPAWQRRRKPLAGCVGREGNEGSARTHA